MPRVENSKLTPAQRSQRGRIAVNESWANTPDRRARTAPATARNPSQLSYWERQVDPDGELRPDQRAQMAESKRKAYFQRLAYKSSQARAARKGGADAA